MNIFKEKAKPVTETPFIRCAKFCANMIGNNDWDGR